MNKVFFSSVDMTWCTPQKMFDEFDREFHFVLDAAASDKNAKCEKYFTVETDGLLQSWDHGGAVFCNPPYGRELPKWVRKASEEAKKGVTIVLLIPARTDTLWFHEYIYGKAEIRFLKGRISFEDENGNIINKAPFPSMLVIFRREM